MSRFQSMRSRLCLEALEIRAVPGSLLTPFAATLNLDDGLGVLLANPFGQPMTRAGTLLPCQAAGKVESIAWEAHASAEPMSAAPRIQAPAASAFPESDDLPHVAGSILLPLDVRGPSLSPGATYLFNDHLFPEQKEAPWLIPLDPLGQNRFETAQVYGQDRQVYHFDGNASPGRENAGLMVGTQGLISPNNYSIEFLFESVERAGSYRKVLDGQDRVPDAGLYLSPSNVFNVYPDGSGVAEVAQNTMYHVVVTNELGNVILYVNGTRDFSVPSTTTMNISNPLGLLYLFADDETTSGEYGDARIALLRFYDGPLSANDVAVLAADPFAYP